MTRGQKYARVIFGGVMFAAYVLLLLASAQVLKEPHTAPPTMSDVVVFSTIVGLVTVAAPVMLNVSVQIRGTNLRLNNILLQLTIAANEIASFESASGVRVRLRDGRTLGVAAAQRSLAASLTGAKFAKKISAQLTPWLEQAHTQLPDPSRPGVQRTFRWSAPTAGIAWILILVLSDSIVFQLTK